MAKILHAAWYLHHGFNFTASKTKSDDGPQWTPTIAAARRRLILT
jgi:hypothetical protein